MLSQKDSSPVQSSSLSRTVWMPSILALIVSVGALFVTFHFNNQKIAYVRSQELIYGYLGTKESHNLFQDRIQPWKSNIDTLQAEFQQAVKQYNYEYGTLTEEERQKREVALQRKEKDIQQYTSAIEEKAKEEETRMTQAVLEQINSFIEQYGKRRGYKLILGTTSSGSILYGEEAIDITKDVLKELNIAYKSTSVIPNADSTSK